MTPPLPDILAVRPFARPARGGVALPGSKSLTNRALLLAALCDGPVTLSGALFSEDTRIMAEALRRLGFSVEEDEAAHRIRVDGRGGGIPAAEAELFTGLAGTATRFLTALCASAKAGVYRIDGVAQMRKVDRILKARAALAARYDEALQGHPRLVPPVVPLGFTHGYPCATASRLKSRGSVKICPCLI